MDEDAAPRSLGSRLASAEKRPEPLDHLRSGRWGEQLAGRFLEDRGARILGTNVRVGRGELDLVVSFRRERAVVEVKSGWRDGLWTADPAEGFTPAKARRVAGFAAALRPPVRRVDLVTVTFSQDGVEIRWVPRVN